MVCSKVDSSDQINSMDGDTGNKADQNFGRSRAIDILTPEGNTLKMYTEDNTTIKCIKIDCELLCGIPSDLQLLKLQGKDLANEETISSLDISDGCTLRVTVPQWWQKFISTCYKGDTQQVRKRIYVKMSQVSREERSFTAAFIGAAKGNHNLMFAAFAGGNINLHSKTKLSGRNLLHAAVSGGSTSCVANILMNGGNALLEAPDNAGETPVKMAEKLYGDAGDIVKFLNVYLELHRRETKNSASSNRFWDNAERDNNNSDGFSADNDSNNDANSRSQSDANINTQLGYLTLDSDERVGEKTRTNYTETEFFNKNSANAFSSVTKVNIEDYDATTGQNSSHVRLDGSSKSDKEQISTNVNNLSSSEQGCVQKSDTGYYSSNNQSIGKDATQVTEMLWNEDLFTQAEKPLVSSTTEQEPNLAHDRSADDREEVTNVSLLSADPDADSNKPARRAQLRKQVFVEQRRKRSTTERPNLELLLAMSSDNSAPLLDQSSEVPENESRDSEGVTNESRARDTEQTNEGHVDETRDKQCSAITEGDAAWKDQATLPTATSSSNRDTESSHSPKPLRRAQLRKKSIVEQQRRRRSMAGRPNLEELIKKHEEKSEEADAIEEAKEEGSGAMGTKVHESIAKESKKETNTVDSKEIVLATIGNKEKGNTVKESKETELTAMDYKEEESPVSARYVLQMWQNQAQEIAESSAANALSGDESDTSHSPKIPRRAFRRKQVFLEQRRRRSAIERPNLIKLFSANRKEDDDEKPSHEEIEMACQDKEEEKLPPEDINNVSTVPASQEGAVKSDFSPVNPSENSTRKEHYSEAKKAPERPSHSPVTGPTQNRVPLRVSQRLSNTGPLLEARAKMGPRSNWSYLSDESDVSENEQKVVEETVKTIKTSSKTQRRRRLPVVPNKTIKLPLIKIEDSGTSTGSDTHVTKPNHVRTSGPVSGEKKSSVIKDNFKVPHPPVGRSRSGSMCSEDSVSSGEMLSERSR